MKKILVTGGTGFIGSHTVVELISKGYEVVIVDNLSNSSIEVLDYLKEITGVKPTFHLVDILDKNQLEKVFQSAYFDGIIHFAGLKAVGESVEKPLLYYENNIVGSLNLYQLASKYKVNNIIFSSSATVYGSSNISPLKEEYGQGETTNPYGSTKKMNEIILKELCFANKDFSVVNLRYFNPIGAHPSGLIGEIPNGRPNNLMPFVSKVACGKLDKLTIFGNDYPTSDGTAIRDYIHVVDLARAHVLALDYSFKQQGFDTFNIGTGIGYSVLDIVNAYQKANNVEVKYEIGPRRAGDIDIVYSDPSKALNVLGFKTTLTLTDMCKDAYNFERKYLK